MFLRNCWYVAAWSSEIGREPLARTLLNEPVLLYRTEGGKAIAMEDRCCHRNLPLSMGKLEGDAVRCGYHGLKFASDGRCIEIPGQENIPPGARVKTWPLVERWEFAWIWMGEGEPDESLLPKWQWMEQPGWAVSRGNYSKPIPMQARWQLNNDNLLDLTHVRYVHAKTLGGSKVDHFAVTTERRPRSVFMKRWIPDVAPIPLWAQYIKWPGGNVDRWQLCEIEAPCHATVDVGFAPLNQIQPDGDLNAGVDLKALITATPETETTSFMFYAQVRNFAVDDAEVTAHFVDDVKAIFMEDVGVMEAQQRAKDARPGAPTIDIHADAPHLAMRRLNERLIKDENSKHLLTHST
jgi:vanillate O-demethylase monooxygenase subunit